MSTPLHVTTTLQPRGPAAAVILTDDEVASLGAGRTPAVRYTVNGQTIEGRIGRMGGENLMGFNKAVRSQLGVQAGDDIDVLIELDDEPRVYETPPALAAALSRDPVAQAAWDALAPSRRKEHSRSVTEAKQDATRDRRVAKIVESLGGT